ncbi:BA75_00969T0 [Komagataella pastoris]|uniref:serine--tRNA ligase n=1 Tax=Komagataella pastoris TaxID=4922 RepID=A0A1B2J609_PICPA|nr:BA75_00969T0 [Komagataella pastoris]
MRFIRYISVSTNSNVLKRPSFDFKSIVQLQDEYIKSCSRRLVNEQTLLNASSILDRYKDFARLDVQLQNLKTERSKLNFQLKNSGANQYLLEELSSLKVKIKNLSIHYNETQESLYQMAESLPNLIHPSVSDKEAIVATINCSLNDIEELSTRRPDPTFDHKSILEDLNLANFQTASRVSGTSFYYMLNDGALLEQALIQYSLKFARQNGYQMVIPPSVVKNEVTYACGFKPRDQNNEQQVYELANSTQCLNGTAEIPLAALSIDAEFSAQDLPKKQCAIARSFRAEAGAHGKDTKGLYRVHEFSKVELFQWTKNDVNTSSKILKDILNLQIEFFTSLGLKCKVMNMPSNDLGSPAYQKFDIECFMPGRGKFGELSSTSNCLDYQARRLNIKYRNPATNKLQFVHTLNGTMCAVPRTIVAIIENFYDPLSKTIEIPPPLRSFMDDKERISA